MIDFGYDTIKGQQKVLEKAEMPCKDCTKPKRHPGCHDHCEEYIEAKKRYKNMISDLTTDWISTYKPSKHAVRYRDFDT